MGARTWQVHPRGQRGGGKDVHTYVEQGSARGPKVTVSELLAFTTPGSKSKPLPFDNESYLVIEILTIQTKMKELEDEERPLSKASQIRSCVRQGRPEGKAAESKDIKR